MNYTDAKIRLLLAKNIKKIRAENDLSQEELAAKAEIVNSMALEPFARQFKATITEK